MIPKFETPAIRTQTEQSQFQEHSSPLYLTSSFVFEDAEEMRASFAEEKERNIYSRFSNPNTSEFIQKVCQMEGSEDGVAFLHYYSMGKADNIKAIAEEIF
jgi:O-succinylhomoserine sulfhydrylase